MGEDEEVRRVVPVVEALAPHVRISIDTRHASVAAAATEAGATLVNDISASLWPVAADAGVGWVAMHMKGEPRTMQDAPAYRDIVAEVRDYLVAAAEQARAAGVPEVWIDPGFGFGKTVEHNLSLLKHLDAFVDTELPVMIGTSRKMFLGRIAGGAPPSDRVEGSLATAIWAMHAGAVMVRVHDVRATVQARTILCEPVAA